jgi:acetyltransferase-like isoleucine patch superfamily enzyme
MIRLLKKFVVEIIRYIPGMQALYYSRGTQTPCKAWYFFMQKILGFNKRAYWPVHFTSKVSSPEKIYAGIDSAPGYMPGCYIYGTAGIYIGDYTQIAPNVGIMSGNHSVYDTRVTIDNESPVVIGDYCWLGMNSMVLPNVVLGDHTIVAAGSVVTKSFPEGYCVVAGVPAKKIRDLCPMQCVQFKNENEYHGYISTKEFEAFRKKKLMIKPYHLVREKYGLNKERKENQ